VVEPIVETVEDPSLERVRQLLGGMLKGIGHTVDAPLVISIRISKDVYTKNLLSKLCWRGPDSMHRMREALSCLYRASLLGLFLYFSPFLVLHLNWGFFLNSRPFPVHHMRSM